MVDTAIGVEVELGWLLTALEAFGDLRDEADNLGAPIDDAYRQGVLDLGTHGAALAHDLHESMHGRRRGAPPRVIADLLAKWHPLARSTTMAVQTQAPKAWRRATVGLWSLGLSPTEGIAPAQHAQKAHRMVKR